MQHNIQDKLADKKILPTLLLPQLLGLCLGLDAAQLGLAQNRTLTDSDLRDVQKLLGPVVEDKKKRKKAASAA